MDERLKPIYEFTFNKNTFEYGTGNAVFYDFRGVNNIYDTMENNLLVGDSAKILRQMIADEVYDRTFTLHIANHSREVSYVACRLVRQESEEMVGLRMIEMDRLFDEYDSFQRVLREEDALLSQYDCVYFTYDRRDDKISCYNYEMGRNVMSTLELSDWHTKVKGKLSADSCDVLDGFVANLRNGIRNFDCIVEDGTDHKITRFVGTAVYDGDVHVKTVGRMGDPNMPTSHELVRRDQLTGLFLKETITNYAKHRIDDQKLHTVLAIIDIDDFKNVNDGFGHAKGDEVLKKCASIISAETGEFGKAGRIGGDEFFVVFDTGRDFEGIKNILRGIKNNIFAAYTDELDGFHVSTSIGLSIYPDDIEGSFDTMFQLADCLLYRAKRKGKNRWIVYNREKHGTVEDVLKNGVQKVGLSGMRGIDKSELVCKITNMMICGEKYPIGSILYDIMNYFGMERVVLYDLTDKTIVTQVGEKLMSPALQDETIDYLFDEGYRANFENGEFVINNVKYFEKKIPHVYDLITRQNTRSLMQYELTGASGKQYIVSYEAVKSIITWNTADMSYLRILARVMEQLL